MQKMSSHLDRICQGQNLTKDETRSLFDSLVEGALDPVEIAALLIALKAKGEAPEEIAGAAESLRASAALFQRPDYSFADTCGTGGDMSQTINVSTAVALVAAEMGIPIAKHGNRSISSKCGSADVLENCGVKIDADASVARRCLDEVGVCFLFAPKYHPGMRFAMPVRQKLKTRTVFNILGPLVNPARPAVQIMGVFDPKRVVPIADTLRLLGLRFALVVHGSGLDEIALHDKTTAALLMDGTVEAMEITPEDAGLARRDVAELKGGTPEENAEALKQLLAGQGKRAHAEAAAINTGALSWIFGKSDDLKEGTQKALETIGSGRCLDRLNAWREASNVA
jgi:anthranilate phosphoribosyltransferase